MQRIYLVCLALCLIGSAVAAQEALRWGADAAGGAPYVYPNEQNERIGFETELVDYLAKELKRPIEFQQVSWSTLPDVLKLKQIDLVLNGYEYSEARNRENNCSLPYYVYKLQLITHRSPKEKPEIKSWQDILKPNPDGSLKSVAVLKGTMALKYLEDHFADKISIEATDDVAEMLELLKDERIDATVQDSPAAQFYVNGGKFPELQIVGQPVGYGLYVILTRPEDEELRNQINQALRKAFASGDLEKILRKYQIWNIDQQRLSYFYNKQAKILDSEISDELQVDSPKAPVLQLSSLTNQILQAAWMTLALAFISMPIAILLGLLIAITRLYGPWPLRALATLYIEVLRGTPLLLQMFVWFFLLPQAFGAFGWDFLFNIWTSEPFLIGIFGLALNYSACEAENYRAGIQAIPRGQTEAALALGMSHTTTLRRIILPQAFRIVIPPVTNDFIALLKDTSICSMILITELTGLYHKYKTFPEVAPQLALTVAVIYFCLSYPLSIVARWLERRQS